MYWMNPLDWGIDATVDPTHWNGMWTVVRCPVRITRVSCRILVTLGGNTFLGWWICVEQTFCKSRLLGGSWACTSCCCFFAHPHRMHFLLSQEPPTRTSQSLLVGRQWSKGLSCHVLHCHSWWPDLTCQRELPDKLFHGEEEPWSEIASSRKCHTACTSYSGLQMCSLLHRSVCTVCVCPPIVLPAVDHNHC